MASFGQNNDWFIIEGTIGAGKSTMCKMLGEALKEVAEVIQEPVDKWRTTVDDESGKNILQNFYEDQQRWSYSFQTYTFLTRMEDMMTKPQQKPIRLVERSIYTDKLVFAKSLADMGKMSRLEWNMYNDWWSWLSKECFDKISHPRGFIYLRTEPKTAYDRMLKRERSEEKCVPLDYLKINVQYHDDWLLSDEFKEKVLVIDVNDEFETDPVEFERIKGLIMEFVESRKSKLQKSSVSSISSDILGNESPSFLSQLTNPPTPLGVDSTAESATKQNDKLLRITKARFSDKDEHNEVYEFENGVEICEIDHDAVKLFMASMNPISNELCDFIGVAHGTKICRNQIAVHICDYISENHLDIPKDDLRAKIDNDYFLLDEKLKTLFSVSESTEKMMYMSIQSHLDRHYSVGSI